MYSYKRHHRVGGVVLKNAIDSSVYCATKWMKTPSPAFLLMRLELKHIENVEFYGIEVEILLRNE